MSRRPILMALLGLVPAAALAQAAPPPTTMLPATASSPATVAPPVQVDTSALAYYAARHDSARVEAEMRRLRSLYPSWQPPADPASLIPGPEGSPDDKPLWDLYGADKLDELDAEIAKRRVANAAYAPPAELVAKVAAKRARRELIAASDRKDFAAVLDIASKNPTVVTQDDIDVSWRVAEAYGRTGATDQAVKQNQTILSSTQDPQLRLATVRKAMLALPPTDIEKLIAGAHQDANGRGEFDAVNLDLVRQRVGRLLASTNGETPTPQDIAILEASARTPTGPTDAALLGWLSSKRQDWQQADSWFQIALKAAPSPQRAKPEDAKVAQGAVIALRALERKDDAENLAYQWRSTDPALALAYIDSVDTDLTRPKPDPLDAERLKRFTGVVIAQQSGDGAQALGWYAYNAGQYEAARAWFKKAMAWQPRDTTAMGLALALKQLDAKDELASFLEANAPTFPVLNELTQDRSQSDQADQTSATMRPAQTDRAADADRDAPPPSDRYARARPVQTQADDPRPARPYRTADSDRDAPPPVDRYRRDRPAQAQYDDPPPAPRPVRIYRGADADRDAAPTDRYRRDRPTQVQYDDPPPAARPVRTVDYDRAAAASSDSYGRVRVSQAEADAAVRPHTDPRLHRADDNPAPPSDTVAPPRSRVVSRDLPDDAEPPRALMQSRRVATRESVQSDDPPRNSAPRRLTVYREERPTDSRPVEAPPRRRVVRVEPSNPDPEPEAAPAQRPRRRATRAATQSACAARAGSGSSATLQSGWCLLELNRPQEAALAFSAAQGSATTRVDGSYGQALADLRNKRTDQAVMAASSGGLTTTRRNEIGIAALAQRAAMTFDAGKYEDVLRTLDQRRMFLAEPRDLAILRAWSTYHTGHIEEARTMFTNLDRQLSTSESRSGIAATNQPSRY